ncbi:dihydrofolate reductase family protein [Microlunatus ginsengisoli]|uniref:Dihydrofolate reductase family protein n=1 Tax=Microlunatus ginsengisoli TaxID=363863 RepID=A0ABP7AU67_9ACTN
MRRLVAVENISLDGVMQAPAGPEEDTRDGFPYGGWAAELMAADPDAARASLDQQGGRSTAMLFGRRTYLQLVGHWLTTAEPNPFTEILRNTPKYVASRTLSEPLPHPNSILLPGDAVEAVAALKADGEGDLVVLGSGVLLRDLAAAGLVDSYVLTILPVVLGRGARLFGDTHARLRVTSSRTTATGIVVATYEVADQ